MFDPVKEAEDKAVRTMALINRKSEPVEKPTMFEPHIGLLKEKIEEIGVQVKNNNKSWLIKRGIAIHDKISCWVLDKSEGDINQWNELTNGLICGANGKLWSFPFTRFFFLGSKEYTPCFDNSDIIEKIQGRSFCVSFLHNDLARPLAHTNTAIDSSILDVHGVDGGFLKQMKQRINLMKFDEVDVHNTYMFKFHNEKIYLVGARRLKDMFEASEAELDALAQRFGTTRPSWNSKINVWIEFEEYLKQLTNSAGVIVRNKETGIRTIIEKRAYQKKTIHCRDTDTSSGNINDDIDFNEAVDKRIDFVIDVIEKSKQLGPLTRTTRNRIAMHLHQKNHPMWAINIALRHTATPANYLHQSLREEILKLTDGKMHRLSGLFLHPTNLLKLC